MQRCFKVAPAPAPALTPPYPCRDDPTTTNDDDHATAAIEPAARLDPRVGLMDHLHDAAFLDTAMGMSTLGTAETVSALGLDGAKNFYGRSLAGSRVVVAGAGAVHQVCVWWRVACVCYRGGGGGVGLG